MNMQEQTNTSAGHGKSEPKWAAIVDDRLAPMPRRRLKAADILHQSGAKKDVALVRDYNSPNDIAFDPEATVDLAKGNVFRTSAQCERRHDIPSEAPPKLAFVVDDRWEVTIQLHQTGSTLRGLLSVPEDMHLLRDFESPVDEPIDDNERLVFADGPVFITRKRNPQDVTIVINGTPYPWSKPVITYTDVVTLFDPSYPQHPDTTYSVKYRKGCPHKPEGILSPGASVKVKNRMEFHVSATGQS